ncbi:hypothetical protein ALC60_01477 [Trachymyrmex zeteki]|uniref:Uncharacterized protein n=1 Tax=Mycetomoellerius zeteki TaxID=64791 RepID=A0A151XGG1_9HYME|nr:hypothetical protein ALC60_01477 [Trachymyrmex zeteki]
MGYRFYNSGKIMPAGVIAILRYLNAVIVFFQCCYGCKDSHEIFFTTLED